MTKMVKPVKILHFADAHIDIASQGKRDTSSGLPYRILDFLKALDTIVDFAIHTPVDLVIFAGDAYRDRTPAPTYQREWGKRMMRLSKAGIPVVLLVGNHDLSPAFGRAHALQEFDTLDIPFIHVIDRPTFLHPNDFNGLPVQVIALPWISRSNYLALRENTSLDVEEINEDVEDLLTKLVTGLIDSADPALPLILTAHASVQGAVYGGERSIMLGKDYILPGSLVRNKNLDYVAMGHIHKPQNLNEDGQPPIIYPGSIERVDFGEIDDQKYFVIADVAKGSTEVTWQHLYGRNFIDTTIDLRKIRASGEDGILPEPIQVMAYIKDLIPEQEDIQDAMARLTLIYPRDWENLIETIWLQEYYAVALDSQIIHKPQANVRLRLGEDESINNLTPIELLDIYLKSTNVAAEEIIILENLATKIIYNQDDKSDLEVGN